MLPRCVSLLGLVTRVPALCVALAALLSVPPSFAGYEFSISASDTDPEVNTSTPTGGVRSLYLWMVCTDDGLAAFEAGVTGTLSVLGFNPLNDVLNIGTSTNLRLAVPGCPTGSFLLGSWSVWDSGGTLCLGTSANGVIGGVDCDPLSPSLAEDPEVTGFASSGSPCTEGSNGCASYRLEESGGGSIGSEWEP